MDKAIIYTTGCKARSLANKRMDLLANGIIAEHMGEYTLLEASEKATATCEHTEVEGQEKIKRKEAEIEFAKWACEVN